MWRIEKAKMVEGFREINKSCEKGQIVFTGSSLIEMLTIQEWIKEFDTYIKA